MANDLTFPPVRPPARLRPMTAKVLCNLAPTQPQVRIRTGQIDLRPHFVSPKEGFREVFIRHGERMALHNGRVLIEAGEDSEGVYFLERGGLLVFPEENVRIEVAPGAVIGEMAFYRPGSVRTATVVGKDGEEVVVYRLSNKAYRERIVEEHPLLDLAMRRVLEDRMSSWPIYKGVRLINIRPIYQPLFRAFLDSEILMENLAANLHFDPNKDTVRLNEIQFGGSGSIKDVHRLEIEINGVKHSVGVRLITTRQCRAKKAAAAARDEVKLFKWLRSLLCQVINMWCYLDTKFDLAPKNAALAEACHAAGVAGIMLGEYIVVNNPPLGASITGISKNNIVQLVGTIVDTWLATYNLNEEKPGKGLIIGDNKKVNFALKQDEDLTYYLDLGAEYWVYFSTLINETVSFARTILDEGSNVDIINIICVQLELSLNIRLTNDPLLPRERKLELLDQIEQNFIHSEMIGPVREICGRARQALSVI